MHARTHARTHTRAAESHTSPFPKAVCIHFTHTAQKKKMLGGGGTEILRQCRSPAAGLVGDRRVCPVIRSNSGAPEASARCKSSLHTRSDQKGFPLPRDSGVKARTDAVPGSASPFRSIPFRSPPPVPVWLRRSACLCLRVSSASPYLLHPSLSLCFPTVIDSSLQSLTAAHQHLLRGDRETCMSTGECVACRAQ